MLLRRLIYLACVLNALTNSMDFSCGQEMTFPGVDWERTTPEFQLVNSSLLEDAVDFFSAAAPTGGAGVDELLIARNGRVIWEGPFIGRAHNPASVTKSFTSTVLGLLVDDGQVSPDTLVSDVFEQMSAGYPELNFRHLVSMTSPYRAMGEQAPFGLTNSLFVPDGPVFDPPGSESYYSNVTSEILSSALTRISGQPIADVFGERIAGPIGMDATNWNWLDWTTGFFSKPGWELVDGIPFNRGSHGLSISVQDSTRLGHLFLNNGEWDGQQIISSEWVEAATTVQVDASLPLNPRNYVSALGVNGGPGVYGYGWWVNGINPDGDRFFPGATPRTYLAKGLSNNVVIVVPEWNMVIARGGSNESLLSNDVWGEFLNRMALAVDFADLPDGDFTADGLVGQGDLDVVLLNWGSGLVHPASEGWIKDIPTDIIDQQELDKVLLNWGSGVAEMTRSPAAVPEPASVATLLVALVALLAVLATGHELNL